MIKSILFQTRRKIFYNVTRVVLTFVILLTTVTYKKRKLLKVEHLDVYIASGKKDFYLAILALLSLDYFVKGLTYYLLEDDANPLSQFQKRVVLFIKGRRILKINVISKLEKLRLRKIIHDYPFLLQYYDYGWSGKKFVIPLIRSRSGKFIITDIDTLFFKFPKKIIHWFRNEEICYFMKDYENFSSLSTIEVTSLIKKTFDIKYVNTGFLLIDRETFWKKTSFKELNNLIELTIGIVKSRMNYDFFTRNDIVYIYPFIEQTLYWIVINKGRGKPLNKSQYFIFPLHKIKNERIRRPIYIHFSGEANRESIYKYLIYSLAYRIKDATIGQVSNSKPWFIYSDVYCPNCTHFV